MKEQLRITSYQIVAFLKSRTALLQSECSRHKDTYNFAYEGSIGCIVDSANARDGQRYGGAPTSSKAQFLLREQGLKNILSI